MAAFSGTLVVCESCFLAQWLVSHRTRQQGGVVTPPKSFAYQASLAHSLLVAQKEKQEAELAPHPPENVPSSKMRNEFKNISPSYFPPGTVAAKKCVVTHFS